MNKRALPAAILMLVLAATVTDAAERDNRWAMATRLYGDVKARKIGDLLTIMIVEESTATREATHKTSKKTDLSGSLSFTRPNIDNRPSTWTNLALPAFTAEGARNYEGGGSMKNQEAINSTLTVRVMEVLPNGNMLVEGKRTTSVNGETVGYILSGTVRPQDVTRDNTIKSTEVADLNVEYFSAGSLSQSQKKGLFTRAVDWVNPF